MYHIPAGRGQQGPGSFVVTVYLPLTLTRATQDALVVEAYLLD